MLNITQNSIKYQFNIEKLESFKILAKQKHSRKLIKLLYAMGIILLVIVFFIGHKTLS